MKNIAGFIVNKTLLILFSLIALLLIQACSNTTSTTKVDKPTPTVSSHSSAPIALDNAHFKNELTIERDDEKGTIKISTVNGFHKKPRRKINAWANNFITALIDIKTGNITYQINSLVEYKDHDKHLYKEVSYNTEAGVKTGAGTKTEAAFILNHNISCLGSAYSGCIHTEHVAFSIDSKLIENIAASYTDGSQNKWRYILTPRKGPSYSAYLFIAEIAALVEMVEESEP